MSRIIQEFDSLKDDLEKKCSLVSDENISKTVISTIQEYQSKILEIIEKESTRIKDLQEENDLLRSLSGISEVEMKAKLLESSVEAKFLRNQLIQVKRYLDKTKKENEKLNLKIEAGKKDVKREENLRREEHKKLKEEIKLVWHKMEQMKNKLQDQDVIKNEVEKKLKEKYQDFEEKIRSVVHIEMLAVIDKLRDLSGIISGTSQFCVERWGKIKSAISKSGVKNIGLNILKSGKKPLSEISPDLELVNELSNKMTKILDLYLTLTDLPKPRWDRLLWHVFWDKMKRKYFDVLIKRQIKIIWPNEKKYPVFYTDEKILTEICENIIKNSLEALSNNGSLEVSGIFKEEETLLYFKDNGVGVKAQDRDKIFLPFFSTKSGHDGLGLTRALKLAKVMEGSLSYKPMEKGSQFILSIPSQK
ncbi:MAG: hypothetical protein JW871_02410 [Endomicrobiales bacterium]|nr:hypothetical protein [Endomicrobiales bacterium]